MNHPYLYVLAFFLLLGLVLVAVGMRDDRRRGPAEIPACPEWPTVPTREKPLHERLKWAADNETSLTPSQREFAEAWRARRG